MAGYDVKRERASLEESLRNGRLDFSAAYMTVCDLNSLFRKHPEAIGTESIPVLRGVLGGPEHSTRKQSFFLYKEAAAALTAIFVRGDTHENIPDLALQALNDVITTSKGNPHRATAEAMGSVPLRIEGPGIEAGDTKEGIPRVTLEEIVRSAGIRASPHFAVMGRSLVISGERSDNVLVVKMADGEGSHSMMDEAAWMEYLRSENRSFPVRFDIPSSVRINGSALLKLEGLDKLEISTISTAGCSNGNGGCATPCAICFIAHKDYFRYPNDHRPGRKLNGEEFREVLFRNSWLLGKLTSSGIVHLAPIPLFHNRIQRHRRADHGLYEWHRGGRLDRWLHSCRYPNFGVTGIRDFEHLLAFKGGGQKLYHHIGSHILSLLLVAGSYFRNKAPERLGFDASGNPVDSRDLFDKPLLEELAEGVFLNYYHGFVGKRFTGAKAFDFDGLASRMIEEMGMDRHMEEVLRVVDQLRMTDEEFRYFLAERGYSDEDLSRAQKGVRDIAIHTGPHLGGFNRRISLPEMVEFVATASALCVVGKYRSERL